MAKHLKDIKIGFISLVRKGANKRKFIYKSSDKTPAFEADIEIAKYDNEQGIVYGVVYAPGEIDTHGHQASKNEIKKAAHAFIIKSNAKNVDIEHSYKPEEAYVAESWIVEKGDPKLPDAPAGSWAVGVQLKSDELRNLAKSGEIQGLSMAGFATIVSKSDGDGIINKILKSFRKIGDENDMEEKAVKALVKKAEDELIEKFDSIPMKTEEEAAVILKSALTEMLKPINDRLEKIEKSTKGSAQSPEQIKKAEEELEKVGVNISKYANGEDD